MLRNNGNAVDAAIAGLFCNGLFNSYAMGVGGGFFMTLYLRDTGEVVHLDARESAPSYASPDMYGDNEEGSSRG